jgi:ribonuclease P protein component
MAGLCWPAAAPEAVTSSRSVMSVRYATPSSTSRRTACLVSSLESGSGVVPPSQSGSAASPESSFPKSRRLLRPTDFRVVYDRGFKVPCSCFVAFCWKDPAGPEQAKGPLVGFTAPRALGKAVARNRMKRRVREVIRKRLHLLDPAWRIVWNLRRAARLAPLAQIESEVEKVLTRCSA